MKMFYRALNWLEERPLSQFALGVLLAFIFLVLLTACGPYPVDCRTDSTIARAKGIEVLIEKPGGRVEPWDYTWAQSIRAQYPHCWNESER